MCRIPALSQFLVLHMAWSCKRLAAGVVQLASFRMENTDEKGIIKHFNKSEKKKKTGKKSRDISKNVKCNSVTNPLGVVFHDPATQHATCRAVREGYTHPIHGPR